ncbi:hypothetical protein ARZXY2_2007 [Arthrobacter sp. ZXY-2]|nr:hypothetical protein ARZXY2_2007 [Arthrobacter sp. ZXY-2]
MSTAPLVLRRPWLERRRGYHEEMVRGLCSLGSTGRWAARLTVVAVPPVFVHLNVP